MRRTRLGLAAVSVVVLVIGGGAAVGATFNDPTTANVVREHDLVTKALAVTDTTSAGFWRVAANDSSGWNDEGNVAAGATIWHSFTLAGPRNIGSYAVEIETVPASLDIEYWDGASWQNWDTIASPSAGRTVRSLTPRVVDQVRYVAHGPVSPLRLNEIQFFLDASETPDLYQGYSWFRDTGRIVGQGNSSNGAVWAALNGGSPGTLNDGSVRNNELKAQNNSPQGGDRAYVYCSLDQAYNVDFAVLGFTKDQNWSNWEAYTSNEASAVAALPGLGANDMATIQAAGWTLQYAHGSGQQVVTFDLASPGDWQHLLLVWNVQHGAAQELELYGQPSAEPYIPEPATMALLGLGALAVLRRKRRA